MENTPAVPSAKASVVQIEIRQAAVLRKFSGMFENVANAANGVNQRLRRVMIHFAAQTINMDIHDIGCGVNPHPPHMIQDHSTRHYAPFIAAKIFKERKLLWRQLQQVIAASSLTTQQIELQVGGLQTRWFSL